MGKIPLCLSQSGGGVVNEQVYYALQWAMGNAKSYDGVLDVQVKFDSLTGEWTLVAGDLALVINGSIVMELLAELPTA